MTLRLNGSSSGYTELDAPAAAGSNTITLPTSNGSPEQFLKNSGTAGELEFSSMVEDSSGRVLIGPTASNDGPNGFAHPLQVEGTGATSSAISIIRNSNDANPPYLSLGKSRGTSTGSNTLVSNGDTVGEITFTGADGSGAFNSFAAIQCLADGTTGNGDAPGLLRLNTTADGSSSPTVRMTIDNKGGIKSFNTDSDPGLQVANSQGAGASYQAIQVRHSSTAINTGTTSFLVFTNGNVQNTNNSYDQISDVKLKENIVDANSQWDDIKGVQIRNFNFKEETGHQTHTQIGVVAQELETVSPGLVYETPDRETVQVPVLDENGEAVLDENGQAVVITEERDAGTVTKAVHTSVLYMKAVKALQEAQTRIETLETKVAALEAAE